MSYLGLQLNHLPAVFLGSAVTLACIPPYFDVPRGVRSYGLPERVATTTAVHSPWLLYTSRMQSIGAMILVFYARGDYTAVDTVMSFIGFTGVVDVYICLKEGVPKNAVFRGVLSAFFAGWGLMGMTSVS